MRIGLLIDYVISEYAERIIRGVALACQEKSAELVIFSIGRLQDLTGAFDYQNLAVSSFVSSNNLDGAIFISGTIMHSLTKSEVASYIKSFKPLPLANISMEIPGIPSIVVDNQEAYESILEELVTRQRCRKFGILGVRGNSSEVKNRIKNIKEILAQHKITDESVTIWKSVLSYGPALEDLRAAYKEMGTFDYDAVICMNDEMAFATLDFCAEIGLKVPDDVAVVGFDNLYYADNSIPTLTTIKQNFEGQGYLAGMNLIREITGKDVDHVKRVDLVLRVYVDAVVDVFEHKHDARRRVLSRGNDRAHPEGRVLHVVVMLHVLQKIQPEFVEAEIHDGNAAGHLLNIHDLVLEPLELGAAVL